MQIKTIASQLTPSKPQPDERVPESTIAYFKTRNKLKAFTLVHREFERSGITKEDLAKRLGKDADGVSHILSAPGNWTLDTISELLFAISGAEPTYDLAYPLDDKPLVLSPKTLPFKPTQYARLIEVSRRRAVADELAERERMCLPMECDG